MKRCFHLAGFLGISLCGCDAAVEDGPSNTSGGATEASTTSAAASSSSGSIEASTTLDGTESGDLPASSSTMGSSAGPDSEDTTSAAGSTDASETDSTDAGSTGGLESQCNPLDPPQDCPHCILWLDEAFVCLPPPPPGDLPNKDGCGSVYACPEGFACIGVPVVNNPIFVDDGECVALCDVDAPVCTDGLSCTNEIPGSGVGLCL